MTDGENLRDAGMAQVLAAADEAFKSHVYHLVRILPERWEGTGEDIRLMSARQPHSPNAWGAMMNQCVRRGWLEPSGRYRRMRQARSHARETRVYVRTKGSSAVTQGQTVILRSEHQRALARRLIDAAPLDAVVNIREATRTKDQNAKMWAMLSDVSRAKPDGRKATPEIWKALFMHALGHEVRFEMGLDGQPFPVGFRSSRLNKAQMADLITFIAEYGDRHAVRWSDMEGV